jgi:large subunit ribosomal protein L3
LSLLYYYSFREIIIKKLDIVPLYLLGKKLTMTQVFNSKGHLIPITIIQAGPCVVTQLKSMEKCGYNAIQIGYEELSPNTKLLNKPLLGHFSKQKITPYRYLKEFSVPSLKNYSIGQIFNLNSVEIGEKVSVSGLTIGKGNTGNIKQHNFSRGPMGHGSKHKRLQGSLGSGTTPGRTFPGKKMPSRFGTEKRTVKGLEILDIDKERNLLALKGSVPGKSGNFLTLHFQE